MKLNKTISIAAISFVAVIGLAMAAGDSKIVKDVKSGVIGLQCHIGTGYVDIDPNKVKDFYPDQGYWKFTNGGSSTCRVVEL